MLLFNIDVKSNKRLQNWWNKYCLVIGKLGRDRIGISAAAIAYFTFFSLIPILIVTIWLFSLWGGESLKSFVINGIPEVVPVSGEFLERLLEEAMSIRSWGFIGIIPLAWTGTTLFYLIEQVINFVWTFPSKGIWKGRLWGSAIVFAFLMFAVFQPVVVYFYNLFIKIFDVNGNPTILWLFASLDRWLLMFFIYAIIYYFTLTKKVAVKYAVISSIVATVGTVLLEYFFVKYVTFSRIFQLYRLIADVMFLLFWFYLMGYIILIGAEVGYFFYHIDRGDLWDELAKFNDQCGTRGWKGSQELLQKED